VPQSIDPNKEIEVQVTAPDKGDYDIKIFFEYQETVVSSEILSSEGWQNSHYYIQDINFDEKTFNLRLQDPDTAQTPLSLCVRLRKADSTSTPQKQCISIDLISNQNQKESEDKQTVLAPIISRQVNQSSQQNYQPISQQPSSEINDDFSPIHLSSKSSEYQISEYTSEGKSKILINYLIALVVLIAIFLVLKSEIKHREI
jgi:hypothetical protein